MIHGIHPILKLKRQNYFVGLFIVHSGFDAEVDVGERERRTPQVWWECKRIFLREGRNYTNSIGEILIVVEITSHQYWTGERRRNRDKTSSVPSVPFANILICQRFRKNQLIWTSNFYSSPHTYKIENHNGYFQKEIGKNYSYKYYLKICV